LNLGHHAHNCTYRRRRQRHHRGGESDQCRSVVFVGERADPGDRRGEHGLTGHGREQDDGGLQPHVGGARNDFTDHRANGGKRTQQRAAAQHAADAVPTKHRPPQCRASHQADAGDHHQHMQAHIAVGCTQAVKGRAEHHRDEQQMGDCVPAEPRLASRDAQPGSVGRQE
jgi:hypothetical protein